MSSLKITTGISESLQLSNFQNATLTSAPGGLACSIAVSPCYPASVTTEAEVVAYLQEKLATLGWDVEVQLGPDEYNEGSEDNA